jgi:hypothetical protein
MKKIDWQIIITELTDRSRGGHTQTALAKQCKCGQSTISEIGSGEIETPNADIGLKLIELHAKLKKPDPTKKNNSRVSRILK